MQGIEVAWYLGGDESRGQQVGDVDGHWRTGPVTLGKRMEASDGQEHHCQFPGSGGTRHTLE